MDMRIFHVKSNKILPIHEGSILIASPLLHNYHFTRSVILMVAHDSDGSVGLIMNKRLNTRYTLNMMIPDLQDAAAIPVFSGGPMERNNRFFIHTLSSLDGTIPLGYGLYLNGDFEYIKKYILDGRPVEGHIRFFAGYSGWEYGQLQQEIEEDSWIVGQSNPLNFLKSQPVNFWKNCMNDLGNPYRLWAKYPQFPSLN